jgi:hypothetical protein
LIVGKWVKAWRQSASDLRPSLEGNFVPASFIYDPEHWRKRADEARSLADDMKDEISKQMTLQIADDYEHRRRPVVRRSRPHAERATRADRHRSVYDPAG